MKIESPSFTEGYFEEVIGDYLQRDRDEIIGRLRRVAGETHTLIPLLESNGTSSGQSKDSWNARETLAHMSITAQFFGWLVQQIAEDKKIDGDLIDLLRLRDPAIIEEAKLAPQALAERLSTHLEAAIGFLETVDSNDLRNSIAFANKEVTAEDFVRISLVHHLEDHLEQMRKAVASSRGLLRKFRLKTVRRPRSHTFFQRNPDTS